MTAKNRESASLISKYISRRKFPDYISVRWMFMITGAFGFFLMFAMRINLSIAIIVMVNKTKIDIKSNRSNDCDYEDISNHMNYSKVENNREFNWDEYSQGLILSSFYWGYIFTQLPGGRLAEVYSAKKIFEVGVLWTAILTLLTPFSAYQGRWILAFNRALQGLGQGVTFPSMNILIARWSPPFVRSQTSGCIYSGALLGMAGGTLLSESLIDSKLGVGWPIVFYFFGTFGLIWCILWSFIMSDYPENNPRMSNKERNFILSRFDELPTDREIKSKFPCKAVMVSLPVWAITVAHFGYNWVTYILTAYLPLFLKDVLHYEDTENGLKSCLPFFTCWIFILISTFLCDELIKKSYLSTTAARKIFNSSGFIIPAILFLGVTFSSCNRELCYCLLLIGYTLNGTVYAGFNCNHVDLSPQFSGTLYGITNTISTLPGIIGPIITGILLQQEESSQQWFINFYLMSGTLLFTGLIYAVFAEGEEQTWSKTTASIKDPNEQEINQN